MIKDFYQRFGLETTLLEAKTRFMSRVDASIFRYYQLRPSDVGRSLLGVDFVQWFSEESGENLTGYINIDPYGSVVSSHLTFGTIVTDVFEKHLLIIEAIFKYLRLKNRLFDLEYLTAKVPEILDKSEINLGIFWKDGKFYPSGTKLLDKKLVEDVLDWLSKFPDEKKDFENALKALMAKRDNDAISDCYNCVEGTVRKILNSKKTLDGNREDLLIKLNISQEWKSLLNNFITYANEYKRHASEKRHKTNPNEVEAFVYLTGLIIRLCIKVA
jgi:hypothetical protein